MHKFALIAAAAAALLGGTALQAREKLTGEEQLTKLLEGRTAGAPVDCINLMSTRDSRIIDKTAIVYDAGNVIYVNRPSGARSLDNDDVMVTELRGNTSQLCHLDVVRLHDRSGFWFNGFVGLEKFTPYRKVALRD